MVQAFLDAEMALFLSQAKEVDIIVTTALIRKSTMSGIELTRSWKTRAKTHPEGACGSDEACVIQDRRS